MTKAEASLRKSRGTQGKDKAEILVSCSLLASAPSIFEDSTVESGSL